MEGRCIFNVGVECDAAVPKCESCGWCPDVEKKRHEDAARERAARGKFQSIHYVLDPGAFPPERAHKEDAGLDLRSPVEVTVHAHGSAVIDTGVHMELPVGSCGMLIPKSGLNVRHDIVSFGLVDAGFDGSILVKLYNLGEWDYTIHKGDKITQLAVVRFVDWTPVQVDSIVGGERGADGFGSTGR